jgi:hypothetical protein
LAQQHRIRRRLPQQALADLVALATDQHIRDNVISWALRHVEDALVPLFSDVVHAIPDTEAAPLCTALAVVAYRAGDGALAHAAAERAIRCEPDLKIARMLSELFSSGIRPEQLDVLLLDWPEHPANPDAPIWQEGRVGSTALSRCTPSPTPKGGGDGHV